MKKILVILIVRMTYNYVKYYTYFKLILNCIISARSDRYSHEIDEDTDDDSLILGTFSSCSPQFKKVASKLSMSNEYPSLSPSVNYKDDSLSINTGKKSYVSLLLFGCRYN